ncbi:GNAT family N-acetyltransferase [Pontibacter ramchanderi]|uniref:Ribosomal-protein-alanine N-acetyltransferase n=1 Tax=Pontibacter ramchanderi TaxID=1179743 RepID=A0A2N3V0U9_9BACT|nr:N-acetyltransferase [Pontibacter ramchanderi]PKV75235.1 ribosomal-protein-alanine N-acetyltransferase [Pontibacter ramchanderi]
MVTIRKAELSDLKAVKTIDELLFGADSYPLFVLRQFYDTTGDYLLIAETGGQVAGYMISHLEQESRKGWLLSLGVLPAHRGKGIGQKLMAATIASLEAKGATMLYLTVHPANAAGISIYTRLGFVEREQVADYYLDGSPRLIMSKQLQS